MTPEDCELTTKRRLGRVITYIKSAQLTIDNRGRDWLIGYRSSETTRNSSSRPILRSPSKESSTLKISGYEVKQLEAEELEMAEYDSGGNEEQVLYHFRRKIYHLFTPLGFLFIQLECRVRWNKRAFVSRWCFLNWRYNIITLVITFIIYFYKADTSFLVSYQILEEDMIQNHSLTGPGQREKNIVEGIRCEEKGIHKLFL